MAKRPPSELPVAIQTLYADLVEKAWTGDMARLVEGMPGSAYSRQDGKGRRYWYWQPPTGEDGVRPSAVYLGRDSEKLRRRIAAMAGPKAPAMRDRRDMVRALRAARLPSPDRLTGEAMAAMAEAGVFRLRAAVVGAVAFQCYPGLLGVRLPASLSRTSDLDLAQFHSVAVAVEDEIAADLEAVLKKVDPRFAAVADPFDSRRTLRYALREDGQEIYSVDVLSPLRGPDRGRVTYLRALRSNARLLRFLDFLLYQEINAVALHGPGIPVNVPAPERFGLHKLLVAQMRAAIPRSQAKAAKDIQQAAALIDALRRQRPHDVADAWEELLDRGPSWRRKAARGLTRLPEGMRAWLLEVTPARHLDEMAAQAGASPGFRRT